ncbi:hypothetical protein ACIBCO_36220 [Streptomyces violascens]|uniref:hypothetical protein n=1 Tax=Streptomyces violascens TaxID=67381 RepID=UPI00378E1007
MTTHTRTRADSRRGRIATREAEREQRRTRFRLFLARADRGVLSPEDSAQFRGDVETEVAEADTHRRSAGGHQAAAMRLHATLAAAEQCIAETEADRDRYAETIRRLCAGELSVEAALDEISH